MKRPVTTVARRGAAPAASGTQAADRTATAPRLFLADLDAVLFDLDGVLTDTASLHEAAWAETFAELFDGIAARPGREPPAPFTDDDYRHLVDGEPRIDGVRHVLADRRITLPEGRPSDGPGTQSAWAVAARQDDRFSALLAQRGPQVFHSAPVLLGRLGAAGVLVAVVSASRHGHDVLAQAGLDVLVDVVVDGDVAAAMGLAGRPDPASYLEAARRLGVDPARAAVVEDALAGVAAGRAGGFRKVVGIVHHHHHQPQALLEAGADLVVGDLGDLELVGPGPLADGWHLTYRPPGPGGEGIRETLCTLGNGYVATRGSRPWASDDGTHYPGTYLAGIYNRLESDVGWHTVGHESLVNAPNWLSLSFSATGGPFFGEPGVTLHDEELRLDLAGGVLRRRCRVVDPAGRHTSIVERRLVSMADPHLGALEVELVAENWSGRLRVRSGIDATCCADQTTEARLLSHCHLRVERSGEDPSGVVWLAAATTQSKVVIAEAARTRVEGAAGAARPDPRAGHVGHEFDVELVRGGRCHLEKVVAISTSRDRAIAEPATAARQAAAEAPGFAQLLATHRAAWVRLWGAARVEVAAAGGPARVVNLHLFHLLQVASPHVAELDCGLGARGLHGEGYEGHVFWDELFVFGVLNLRFPEIARALLRYRHRRLPAARRLATRAGEAGARFPWQSGSDGSDLTPTMLFNPRSGRWMADRSTNQRHVGLAVAYNCWRYVETTGDAEFMAEAGAEIVFEVARHFSQLASLDEGLGRFRIRGVMGPDEFHDGYPWSKAPGVDDNAYTNVLVAWLAARALELAERLAADRRSDTLGRLGIDEGNLARFEEVSRGLSVPFHDGVISQFAGYGALAPIDLDAYRARYGNIGRLDLILEAEGDTVRRYQVGKQADTLMLFYLFSSDELRGVFGRLGYGLNDETVARTIDYYTARVTHGSTLSRVVHAWVAARQDRAASWRHFTEALAADMADTQGGTTREGIHLGAMAGTVDLLGRCYSGLEVRGDVLRLDPVLPDELAELHLTLSYRSHRLDVCVDQHQVTVASAPCDAAPIRLVLTGRACTLAPGEEVRRRRPRPATHHGRAQADHAGRFPTTKPIQQGSPDEKEHVMATVTDPVCGMTIEEPAAAGSTTHEGTTYYFCSPACQERFEAEPDAYVGGR